MDENTTYLIHRKGEERADHKYVKREFVNGKWRYYYEENGDGLFDSTKKITTAQTGEHIITKKGKISQTADKVSQTLNKWKSSIDDMARNMKVAKIKATDKGQTAVNNLLKGIRVATGVAAKEDMARQQEIMENASARKKDALTKHKENVSKVEEAKNHQSKMEKSYGDFNKKVNNIETQAARLGSKIMDPKTSSSERATAVKEVANMDKSYDNYKQSRDNAKQAVDKAKEKTKEYNDNIDFYKNKAKNAQDSFVDASLKYYKSKSIYDKSLVGRIDKASEWFSNLFKKDDKQSTATEKTDTRKQLTSNSNAKVEKKKVGELSDDAKKRIANAYNKQTSTSIKPSKENGASQKIAFDKTETPDKTSASKSQTKKSSSTIRENGTSRKVTLEATNTSDKSSRNKKANSSIRENGTNHKVAFDKTESDVKTTNSKTVEPSKKTITKVPIPKKYEKVAVKELMTKSKGYAALSVNDAVLSKRIATANDWLEKLANRK